MSTEYRIVPVEPTKEMLNAGDEAARAGGCDLYGLRRELLNGWAAMLAAAPVPPAGGEPEVVAIVCGSQVQWQPHSAMLKDRSNLYSQDTITRLQAEVARLKAGVGSDMAEIDRIQGEYDKQWRKARGLRSELTKARELLAECSQTFDACTGMSKQSARIDWYANHLEPNKRAVREYLQDSQSAPAAKEVRLLSVADDMSTCTLSNGDGQGYFYDRIEDDKT